MSADLQLFANNAVTTLASPINPSATQVQVVPGAGALFPNPAAGQVFLITLIDAATGALNEIMKCTSRVADVLTVVRGQEGTTPASWSAGDIVTMLVTAGTMANVIQVIQAQKGAYAFAQDTGSANSYVAALSPAVTQRIPGLEARIKAANANTTASTLDLGAGPAPIVNPDGSAVGAGAIVAGGIFIVIDDGTNYQLVSASQELQSSAGVATTGDVKWRPTNETIAGWVIANATWIGSAASNANQRANADCANLFAWHWNNFSATQCPVQTSGGAPTTRGANAAADFAANKQIQVLDLRGVALLGMDTMGNGNPTNFYNNVPVVSGGGATSPGSIIGESLHTLTQSQAPVMTPTFNGTTDTVSVRSNSTIIILGSVQNAGLAGGPNTTVVLTSGSTPGFVDSTGSFTPRGTITAVGGGGSHNTVDRGMVGRMYLKL